MIHWLGVAVASAVTLGALWALTQAWWSVGDRAPLVLAGGFLFFLGFAEAVFDTPLGHVVLLRLAANLAALARDCCLICWFLVVLSAGRSRRGLTYQLAVFAFAESVAIGAWVVDPLGAYAGIVHGGALLTHRAPALFITTIETYNVFSAVVLMVLCATWARRVEGKEARRALSVLTIAFVIMTADDSMRDVPAMVMLLGGQWSSALNAAFQHPRWWSQIGYTLMLLGLVYLGGVVVVRGWPIWREHRQIYLDLRPLWLDLREGFPDWITGKMAASWSDWIALRGTHRRFVSRLIDVWDGLVLLAPYRDPSVGERAVAEARDAGLDEATAQARGHAATILDALHRRRAGARLEARPAWDLDSARTATVREEARRLAALSRQYALLREVSQRPGETTGPLAWPRSGTQPPSS